VTTPVPLDSPIAPGNNTKPIAERRYLTILFCDIVGSTEYADRLDPEDFQRLIESFLQTCSNVIHRRKGVTASYIGDAIQAYFGYPIAGEDDSEFAVLAALDIIDAVATVSADQGHPLQVRVGIASGQVVVGEFVGAPSGVSTVAFGHVAHLAARLQVLATPNTILVDTPTFEAASGAVDFIRFGQHELKGFTKPIHVWQVRQARSTPTRFAKRPHVTKLCGRNAELRLLMERWSSVARDGRGHAVLVSGESGIGKSRLLNEMQQRLRNVPQLTLQCSPTFENSTLYPFLAELQRIAMIEEGDTTDEKLTKLKSGLSMGLAANDVALSIFANLLGIPSASHDILEDMSAERQRNIAEQSLTELIGYLARSTPILILFEDEQWADATSRDLLANIVTSLAHTSALLLVSSRNNASVPWTGQPHVDQLSLEALGRDDAEAIIRDISPNLLAADVSMVLDRSEGVPLYVEELTRSVVETGLRFDASTPKRSALVNNIPNSLQFSLLARLDRLGPVKEVAQIAASIGREFNLEILREVCDWPEAELRAAIAELMRAGLVVAERGAAGPGYSFAHVLLQQAARGTMLLERAQQVHKAIAEHIELHDQNAALAYPEVLAEHFAEAGLPDRAADYWLLAGLKAARTWAKVDAARIFRKGLESAKLLQESDDRSRRLLRFELELGDVLYAALGYVTGEGSAAYQRAIAISARLGEPESTIRALDGLFGTHFNSGQFGKALAASDELIRVGEQGGYLKALVIGLQFKGMSLFCQGKFAAARLYLERALSHKDRADEIGSDFPSMAMIYLSWTLHILGYRHQALNLYREAEATVRRQSAYRLAACLGNGCVLFAFRDENKEIARLAAELLPLAQENGFNLWARVARFFGGLAESGLNDRLVGANVMTLTESDLEDQEVDKSCYLGLLAKAFLNSGQLDFAAQTVDKGLQEAEKTGEHYFTGALLRIRGEVELANGDGDRAAEASFREAIKFARQQKAKSWELQATSSLSRLLRSQGRFIEARSESRRINNWFAASDVA